MAGIGSLTNENWHMFEPSPIETQLALADPVKNPRAVALLPGYTADRVASQAGYQQQVDWMHQQQLAEFQQKSQNDQRTLLSGILQHVASTPGGAQAARTAGLLPQGVDTSVMEKAAADAAGAKNLGEMGSGLGKMGDANFNVQSLLNNVLPGVVQGPNARIAAAQVGADGRRDAAAIRNSGAAQVAALPTTTYQFDTPAGSIRVNSARKGNPLTTQEAMQAAGIDPNSAPGRRALAAVQPTGGGGSNPAAAAAAMLNGPLPAAPTAQDRSDAAPFMQPTAPSTAPPATMPAVPAAVAKPSVDAVNKFVQQNPQQWADVQAARKAGKAGWTVDGGRPVLLGASGQKYPLPQ